MREIRREERFAFGVVARVLGEAVDPFDIDGRQHAVDAMVRYSDGRLAAVEVSSIGSQQEAAIMGFLGDRGSCRSVPGLKRRWLVELPRTLHPADMRKVESALRSSEASGLNDLRRLAGRERDVDALLDRGLRGFVVDRHSEATASVGSRVYFMLSPLGGFTGQGMDSLPRELTAVLGSSLMQSKLAKLAGTGLNERHLVLVVRPTAFSFPIFDGLAFGGPLPRQTPSLPSGLTQVWLITGIRAGGVIRGIAGQGWTRDDPYVDMTHIRVA